MPDPAAPPDAPAGAPADASPCQACGACCAAFRVSFHWLEADARALPEPLVERVSAHLLCMRGTWAARPRCAALAGEVGRAVACTAYERRPSPCREVQVGDAQCAKARAIHGLRPLAASTG
jgi:Fe-S-cluster containining protein